MKHKDIEIDIDIDKIIEDARSNLAYNGVYRKREERVYRKREWRVYIVRCALIIITLVALSWFVVAFAICIV